MTFTAATAGTMAQILAVLTLAVSFTPWLRGAKRPGTIRGPGFYFAETKGARHDRATWREVLLIGSLVALFGDVAVLLLGVPLAGWLAWSAVLLNALAVLALLARLVADVRHHHDED